MEVSRAIDLIDDKMCWGRGTFSAHHMPERDEYWQAGEMAIEALKKQEAIKSCTPPSDDWEHYADRLHDIAYQSGYEQGKKDAKQDRWIPVTEKGESDGSI